MIQKQTTIMKRSNLFLALTTGALAVASFAFAKTNRIHTKSTGYCFTKAQGQLCHHTINKQWTTVSGTAKATCGGNLYTTAHTKPSCAGNTLYTGAL